jgi:hypothetical protein
MLPPRKGRAASESDLWQEYKRAQQRRRAERLPRRAHEILALRRKGFDVVEIASHQFRIDGALDLFPLHRGFHDLRTQERGGYQNPVEIAVRLLRTPPARQSHPPRAPTQRCPCLRRDRRP